MPREQARFSLATWRNHEIWASRRVRVSEQSAQTCVEDRGSGEEQGGREALHNAIDDSGASCAQRKGNETQLTAKKRGGPPKSEKNLLVLAAYTKSAKIMTVYLRNKTQKEFGDLIKDKVFRKCSKIERSPLRLGKGNYNAPEQSEELEEGQDENVSDDDGDENSSAVRRLTYDNTDEVRTTENNPSSGTGGICPGELMREIMDMWWEDKAKSKLRHVFLKPDGQLKQAQIGAEEMATREEEAETALQRARERESKWKDEKQSLIDRMKDLEE